MQSITQSQSISDQMLTLFVTVDDFLKARPHLLAWRRSPNAKPVFTDAEVITIGLLQGCLGTATLKRAYQIVSTDFRAAFPRLPTYAQWIARLHALAPIIGSLIQYALPALEGEVYLLDSKPIPVCRPIRHGGYACCGIKVPTLAKEPRAGTLASNFIPSRIEAA